MEYARRCTVCGKIYCYTDQDLRDNQENAVAGAASAIGAIASIFGGTAYQTFEFNKMSDRSLDKVIDYNKCPNCGSSSTVILSADELEKYKNNEPDNTVSNPQPIAINTNASPDALVERGMLFLEDQEWDKATVYFENALDADPKNVRAYIGKLLVDLQLSKEELLVDCDADFTDNPNFKKALRFSSEQEKEQLESIPKERTYKIAKEVSGTDLKRAIELLDPIKDYKDSSQLIDSYSETIKYNKYETALSVRDSVAISRLTEATSQLEELGDYRDAKKLVAEYYSRIKELEAEEEKRQQEKREQKYEAAVSLYKKAGNLQDYEKARTALQEMKGYKDCDELASESQKKIEQLTEIKQQEEARSAAIKEKKKKRTIGIISAMAIVCVVALIVVIKVIIPNNKYNNAVVMMEKGEYDSAIEGFKELQGFKDSNSKIEECLTRRKYKEAELRVNDGLFREAYVLLKTIDTYAPSKELMSEIEAKHPLFLLNIGDTFTLGNYEQDNDLNNGMEPIEWVIIDKDEGGNQFFVISNKILDSMPYHNKREYIHWDKCSVREWLNSSFYNTAFSDSENKDIIQTKVKGNGNHVFGVYDMITTEDKLFYLSLDEIYNLYGYDNDRSSASKKLMSLCTPYAISRGAVIGDNGYGCWGLRSPGSSTIAVSYVSDNGMVCGDGHTDYNQNGVYVDAQGLGVRPAMKVNGNHLLDN